MSKPWEIVKPADRGEERREDLYWSVGRALSEWEFVESRLADLFSKLLGGTYGAAARAFGVINSSGSKRDMISEAAEWLLPDDNELLGQVSDVLDQAGKLSARRNDIAHGMASGIGWSTDDVPSFYLTPGFHVSKKFNISELKKDPSILQGMNHGQMAARFYKYAYTSSQINTYADHFEQLAKRIQAVTVLVAIVIQSK